MLCICFASILCNTVQHVRGRWAVEVFVWLMLWRLGQTWYRREDEAKEAKVSFIAQVWALRREFYNLHRQLAETHTAQWPHIFTQFVIWLKAEAAPYSSARGRAWGFCLSMSSREFSSLLIACGAFSS